MNRIDKIYFSEFETLFQILKYNHSILEEPISEINDSSVGILVFFKQE